MDQFVTRIALMDMHNKLVQPAEKFELPLAGNADALTMLTEKIASVLQASGLPKERIAGIGIGMPGFVDFKKGLNHSFLKTSGQSITDAVERVIGIQTYIDNDSSLIALAELRFGSASGHRNAMVVNIGWGVGLGMIINGSLFRGHNGFAGEFSHIPLFSNGKLCSCGKMGCLETETSLLVSIAKAKEGLAAGKLSGLQLSSLEHLEEASESLMRAAEDGDRFAVELFSQAGYNIGRGVAILIHLLNPELVILSGRGSTAGRVWLAPVQQAINEHSIPRIAANTQLEVSRLGYEAELIGAAALVMENYEEPKKEKPKKDTSSLIH
jgi:predicted NBD/HSP70 family sugar kinase